MAKILDAKIQLRDLLSACRDRALHKRLVPHQLTSLINAFSADSQLENPGMP